MTRKHDRIREVTFFNSVANKSKPRKDRKRSSEALLSFYGESGRNRLTQDTTTCRSQGLGKASGEKVQLATWKGSW